MKIDIEFDSSNENDVKLINEWIKNKNNDIKNDKDDLVYKMIMADLLNKKNENENDEKTRKSFLDPFIFTAITGGKVDPVAATMMTFFNSTKNKSDNKQEEKINENTKSSKFGIHNIKEEPVEYNGDKMWRIYKFDCRDLFPDGEIGEGTYPAFICNGVEKDYIDIACYPASKGKNNKPVSIEKEIDSDDFWTEINLDEARNVVNKKNNNKYKGYHLMTFWEWALVSYLYEIKYKNQTDNINCSHNKEENGIRYMFSKNKRCNWTIVDGIKSIGYKPSEDYECKEYNLFINYIKDNNYNLCVKYKENNWFTYILKKYDEKDKFSKLLSVDRNVFCNNNKQIKLLKAGLIIHPNKYKFDGHEFILNGERMLNRGGHWLNSAYAGLGAFILYIARSDVNADLGFRFARFD